MLFHQKQKGSYCRLHSLNNLMGKQVCGIPEFDKYCDAFDKQNKFEINCSKLSNEFYNNGGKLGNDNIFGYILKNKGIDVRMVGFDRHRKQPINITDTEDLLGAIVLRPGHTFCIRYHNSKWIVIDSLNSQQPEIRMNYFQNKGLAFLFVYLDLNIMNKISLE